MLDETLPPGGDQEPAADGPARETTEAPVPAAAGGSAAGAGEAFAARAQAEEEPAEVAGDEGAIAGEKTPPPLPAAPAPEMSPAACAAQLAERFAGLFAAGRALPIKLRIQADIQARAPGVFTRKAMSLFLHRYTTSTAYLKALVASPHRFDLDGAPAGEVAAEHRDAAQVELQRRQAIVQDKRSAQRRMERPPRPAPGPRSAEQARPPAGGLQRPGPGRAEGTPRPPRPPRPTQPPRPPMPQRRDGADAAVAHPPPRAEHQPPSLPPAELEARRERAALLRAYESSTLTKANFCALKRLSQTDLDNQLALARSEQQHQPRRAGVIDPPPARR